MRRFFQSLPDSKSDDLPALFALQVSELCDVGMRARQCFANTIRNLVCISTKMFATDHVQTDQFCAAECCSVQRNNAVNGSIFVQNTTGEPRMALIVLEAETANSRIYLDDRIQFEGLLGVFFWEK